MLAGAGRETGGKSALTEGRVCGLYILAFAEDLQHVLLLFGWLVDTLFMQLGAGSTIAGEDKS